MQTTLLEIGVVVFIVYVVVSTVYTMNGERTSAAVRDFVKRGSEYQATRTGGNAPEYE